MSLGETSTEAVEVSADDGSDVESFDDAVDDGGVESFDDFRYDEGQVKQLDKEVKIEKGKDKGKEDEEGEEQSGKSGEGKDKEDSGDSEEAEEEVDYKAVTGKFQDSEVDIPVEAEIRVKVNGKNETVTIQDLMDNYSGKVAYDKKFSDLGAKNKELIYKEQQLRDEMEETKEFLRGMVSQFDDEKANPINAMYNFLDATGRDSLKFHKRVMDYFINEAEEYSQYDEVQRRLYWSDKQNEILLRRQESLSNQRPKRESRNDHVQEIDRMREAQGISEAQFLEAYESLIENGTDPKTVTGEMVIEMAKVGPYLMKAEELVRGFENDLDDDDVMPFYNELAKVFKGYPEIDEDTAVNLVAKRLGYEMEKVDPRIESMKSKYEMKTSSKKSTKKSSNPEEEVETFDRNYF